MQIDLLFTSGRVIKRTMREESVALLLFMSSRIAFYNVRIGYYHHQQQMLISLHLIDMSDALLDLIET